MSFLVAGGAFAFLLVSFCNVWIVWHVNPQEGLGYHVSFWSLIWETLFQPTEIRPEFPVTIHGDPWNAALAGVVV